MDEFINRDFPEVVVEFVTMAELRRGEIKEPVVVYSRKGKVTCEHTRSSSDCSSRRRRVNE